MKSKKRKQLGMDPSTASGRLLKDILFMLITSVGQKCYRCGEELTRETFSIDHKIPWLDSNDPAGLYFDLENIAFSHISCNISAGRTPGRKYHTKEARRLAHNEQCRKSWNLLGKNKQRKRKRESYLRNNK